MEEAMAARYWCYRCSQMVSPILEAEMKCPFCQGGFIEEMNSTSATPGDNHDATTDSDFGSDRALSLWAPILLGMMNNHRRPHRRLRRLDFDDDDDDDHDHDDTETRQHAHAGDSELDWEVESIIRRRRRSSATILQLLQGIRSGLASESDNSEGARGDIGDRERERERLILVNPFNQTIVVQGSYDSSQGQNNHHTPIGSLGDYFIGPGLDLLLHHLAENDPNRYGIPPAQKDAVQALPTVSIKETLQCSVCLDDFEVGVGAKEMPCKHKFHSGCILPWLELHSSCPVCRFQLPADESKRESDGSRNHSNQRESENVGGDDGGEEGDGDGRNGSGRRFSIPWPFNGLFSNSGSQSSGSGGSNSSSSANATGSGSTSRSDDN